MTTAMKDRQGYSSARASWANTAAEDLFIPWVRDFLGAKSVTFAWESGIEGLDLKFGVDALVTFPREQIPFAIRIRGRKYLRYGDVTIRTDSLQTPGKELEISRSISTVLWYAWGDTDAPTPPSRVEKALMIDFKALARAYHDGTIPYSVRENRDRGSRFAAFAEADLRERDLILPVPTVRLGAGW